MSHYIGSSGVEHGANRVVSGHTQQHNRYVVCAASKEGTRPPSPCAALRRPWTKTRCWRMSRVTQRPPPLSLSPLPRNQFALLIVRTFLTPILACFLVYLLSREILHPNTELYDHLVMLVWWLFFSGSCYWRYVTYLLGWMAAAVLPTSPMENWNKASLKPTDWVIINPCCLKLICQYSWFSCVQFVVVMIWFYPKSLLLTALRVRALTLWLLWQYSMGHNRVHQNRLILVLVGILMI